MTALPRYLPVARLELIRCCNPVESVRVNTSAVASLMNRQLFRHASFAKTLLAGCRIYFSTGL